MFGPVMQMTLVERHCRCRWFETLASSCLYAHGKSALDYDAHCYRFCLHFYQVKHQARLFCLFGVTSDVSYLWMINIEDDIMKFCPQAEQAQLRGAHMQTFIIEQQAFIIHCSGFPCSPQINYKSAHTFIDIETQTLMNIQSRASFADRNLVC